MVTTLSGSPVTLQWQHEANNKMEARLHSFGTSATFDAVNVKVWTNRRNMAVTSGAKFDTATKSIGMIFSVVHFSLY